MLQQWNETCTICYACAEQLNIACSFRKLCLQSNCSLIQPLTKSSLSMDNCEIVKQILESNCNKGNSFYSCCIHNNIPSTNISSLNHSNCNIIHKPVSKDVFNSHKLCQYLKESQNGNIITYQLQEASDNKTNKGELKIEENTKVEDQSSLAAEEYQLTNGDNNFDDEQDCIDNCDVNSVADKLETKSKTEKNSKVHKRKRFNCGKCNSYFLSSKKLINHSFNVHGLDSSLVKPFACDRCESKFSTSSNLLQHKKYHAGNRTHICTFCGKGFITKNDLNIHEKQHLNKREYKCSHCPKTFNTHKDLRTHRVVVHTDPSLWNYVCTFCPKRFPIKSNLDQHTRRHMGEKRFGCHICEKRFVDKCVLQKHIKSHSNFRAFKCEYCNKEYKENRILEIHKTKIHGVGNAKIPVRVKKHFCHICPKSYFAKNKLTRHMFSHTGEKPYVCHMCDRKFTDKSYVKQHLRTTHNIVEMDENR